MMLKPDKKWYDKPIKQIIRENYTIMLYILIIILINVVNIRFANIISLILTIICIYVNFKKEIK